MTREEFQHYCDEGRMNDDSREIGDGIWILDDDIDMLWVYAEFPWQFAKKHYDDIAVFIQAHPNWCIGHGYQTYGVVFLSREPKEKLKLPMSSGFNYGTTSIIPPTTKRLLILAEDD